MTVYFLKIHTIHLIIMLDLKLDKNFRGVLRWRQCHCKTCLCDKELAGCLASYRCPYKISLDHKTEDNENKNRRYLSKEECKNKPINVTQLLVG